MERLTSHPTSLRRRPVEDKEAVDAQEEVAREITVKKRSYNVTAKKSKI
jgi:hypothetical protein